jgi:hypothetical protein
MESSDREEGDASLRAPQSTQGAFNVFGLVQRGVTGVTALVLSLHFSNEH